MIYLWVYLGVSMIASLFALSLGAAAKRGDNFGVPNRIRVYATNEVADDRALPGGTTRLLQS